MTTETAIPKTQYLTVYDYETGGVWAFVLARTPDEIRDKFKNLEVIERVPSWMTDEQRADIEERMTFDIDDVKPGDWIAQLLREQP